MSAPPVNSGSSQEAVTNKLNDTARELQALQTTQIFKDDTGTRRVLLGKGADGFYGLKVSQEGIDVFDAPNDQLVFNSSQNVFKIVQTGVVNLTKPSGSLAGNVSITHNLNYVPGVMAFVLEQSGSYRPLPMSVFLDNTYVADNGKLLYKVDTSEISDTVATFECRTPNLSGPAAPGNLNTEMTFQIKYYLLQESAA